MSVLLLVIPVVTAHASSNCFFATEVQVSNYWRTTSIQPEDEFATGEEEQGEAEEIEELLIDEQDELCSSVENESNFIAS